MVAIFSYQFITVLSLKGISQLFLSPGGPLGIMLFLCISFDTGEAKDYRIQAHLYTIVLVVNM